MFSTYVCACNGFTRYMVMRKKDSFKWKRKKAGAWNERQQGKKLVADGSWAVCSPHQTAMIVGSRCGLFRERFVNPLERDHNTIR